jgi:hypothetical protein
MITKASGYVLDNERRLELPWLPFVSHAVVLRSAIVAVVVGSVLTLINQPAWAAGNAPLQILPLILVFVTPFAVVAVSQIVAERRAFTNAARHGSTARRESFFTTTISHGIPARALKVGLIVGSINAIISLADAFLHSGDIALVSLGQAYVLPLLFGVLSQAISYRRAENSIRKAETVQVRSDVTV